MSWDTIQQFIRILGGWLAAILVTKGIADESNAQVLIGGLTGIVQFGWWFFWNRNTKPTT